MPQPIDTGHRGDAPSYPGSDQSDPRIAIMEEMLASMGPDNLPDRFIRDPHRKLSLHLHQQATGLILGKILQALPANNLYRVQGGATDSSFLCTLLSPVGSLPLGPHHATVLPANCSVLVFRPANRLLGLILGVLPEETIQGDLFRSDWVQQGGNTGSYRDLAHRRPLKLFRDGGVHHYGNVHPADATSLDWGVITETGAGVHIDPFQVYLRVSEACGLFLNHYDGYLKLIAMNLDWQNYAQQWLVRQDEGENLEIRGSIVYPWEALGEGQPGGQWTQKFDEKDVLYRLPRGTQDLKEGEEDRYPIQRYVEYGGYLGQGRLRQLMVTDAAHRRYRYTHDQDVGLWREAIGLDGAFSLESAKSIYVGKRVGQVVPKRIRLPEDGYAGDDAQADNYKFSSQFGGGEEHCVGDLAVPAGEPRRSDLGVAAVLDRVSYAMNWQAMHPFYYHKGDYHTPEEPCDPFARTVDSLGFGELAGQPAMAFPQPKPIRVDHRYGNVNYYQRESFWTLADDGSVAIGCGYGASLVFSGGNLRIECPGDIELVAGRRVVQLAWDIVLRAKNSLDGSATNKDVRLKAQRNLQLLAGNSGYGGVLVESKATAPQHLYKDRYGEDVVSSGVVLLAKKSEVGLLGRELYLRTGDGEVAQGNITLDASKGKKSVLAHGKHVDLFATNSANIWHPTGEEGEMVKNHRFSPSVSMINTRLITGGDVIVNRGNVLVEKSIFANGNIVAKKKMAQAGGGMVGDSSKLNLTVFPITARALEEHRTSGTTFYKGWIVERWYAENRLGNEDLLVHLGFSFRDPASGDQYRTGDQFSFVEPRWQQLVRLGLASGGTGWEELPVVASQGRETYPWPGKKYLVDEEALLGYQGHRFFDDAAGKPKPRPYLRPGESAELNPWQRFTLNNNLKTIL